MSLSPEQHLQQFGFVEIPLDGGKGKSKTKFNRTSLTQIMATEYLPLSWAVEGYLPEGFSVLAGRQKLGKTWLALDWSIAVATGGYAMGQIPCDKGNVLYLDLENGHRRIKRRIETIFPDKSKMPDFSGIQIVSESPQLDKDFIAYLDEWRQSVDNPRLIVIDVLQRVKPVGSGNRNAYENDYSIFSGLQSWATQHGVAILGLHHTRKGGAEDPLEALSGSNGLSACADTTLLLDKDQNGMTLYVRGRDVEERETALRHDVGIWTLLGAAAEVYRSDERKVIVQCLADNRIGHMTPSDIAGALRLPVRNVKQLLHKMAITGEVVKTGRGKYFHPENVPKDCISATPDNFDNRDNQAEI